MLLKYNQRYHMKHPNVQRVCKRSKQFNNFCIHLINRIIVKYFWHVININYVLMLNFSLLIYYTKQKLHL